MKEINEDSYLVSMISAMLETLAEVTLFRDIQPTLQQISVEYLLRLTLGFLKTYEEELQMFEEQPEEYFVLSYYIIFGKSEEDAIDLTLGEICLKKNVVLLMKNLSEAVEGANSMLLQLCIDIVTLEMKVRQTHDPLFKTLFLDSHKLPKSVLDLVSLENALLAYTVLLRHFSNALDRRHKFRQLLDILRPQLMTQLELTRLYVCLSVHSLEFRDNDVHCKQYALVEAVFRMNKKMTSLSKIGFFFLERLTSEPYYENKKYCIFIDKLLNDCS
jgi:hypothetical protein